MENDILKNDVDDDIEISITDIINMFLKRWRMVAAAVIVAGVLAFSVTELFIAPTYSSGGLLYVSNSQMSSKSSDISYSQIQSAQALVITCSKMLQSDTFMAMVSEDVNGKYLPDEIKGMVDFQSLDETELMQVTVKAHDPHEAYEIANSVINNAPGYLTELMQGGDVKIVDSAKESAQPVGPNVLKNTALGLVGGFVIGCVLIFCLELFDTRIKSSDQITKRFNIAILGEIPSLDAEEKPGEGYYK